MGHEHGADAASMRPRHKAAENGVVLRRARVEEPASMRPRHKAAENEADVVHEADPVAELQ